MIFVSTVFTWAISTFSPPITNSLESIEIHSDIGLSLISAPAFNMCKPYVSTSTPAISASFFAACLSSSVLVCDLNNKESEIIADNINPAIFLGISTLFSSYIFLSIVAVHPTGSARKYRGFAVSKLARSEEHTSELQSRGHLVCRLLLEKKTDKEQ